MSKHPNNRYKRIYRGGKHYYEHRLVWEAAHGPIPAGHHIHHRNGDPRDNRLENLECIPHGQHNAIHHRKEPVPCAQDGCERVATKRALCDTHYVMTYRYDKVKEYGRQWRAANPEKAREGYRRRYRRKRERQLAEAAAA